MDSAYLECEIGLGQFRDEFAVRGKTVDGEFSVFTSGEFLDFDGDPPSGKEWVRGSIRVEIIDEGDGVLLVRLPQQSLENGRFVTVRQEAVEA